MLINASAGGRKKDLVNHGVAKLELKSTYEYEPKRLSVLFNCASGKNFWFFVMLMWAHSSGKFTKQENKQLMAMQKRLHAEFETKYSGKE